MEDNTSNSKETSFRQSDNFVPGQSSSYNDRAVRRYIQSQSISAHPDIEPRSYVNQRHVPVDPQELHAGLEGQHLQRQLSGLSDTSGASLAYLQQAPFNMLDINYRYNYLGMPNKLPVGAYPMFTNSEIQNSPKTVYPTRKLSEGQGSHVHQTSVVSPSASEQDQSKVPYKGFHLHHDSIASSGVKTVDELIKKAMQGYNSNEGQHQIHSSITPPLPLIGTPNITNMVDNSGNPKSVLSSQTLSAEHVCEEVALASEGGLYKCGGCTKEFKTICQLHDHLRSHDSGGSYYYSHLTMTAFPKFDTMCKETQTVKEEETVQLPIKRKTHNLKKKCAGVEVNVSGDDVNIKSERAESVLGSFSKNDLKGKDSEQENYVQGNVMSSSGAPTNIKDENEVTEYNEMDARVYDSIAENDCDTDGYDVEADFTGLVMTNLALAKKKRKKKNVHRRGLKDSMTSIGWKTLRKVKSKFKITDGNKTKKKKQIKVKIEKKCRCDICDKGYATKAALNFHRVKAHDEISMSRPKECRWCGDIFPSSKHLVTHLKTCDKNDNRKCFVCDQQFPGRPEMMEHLVTHRNSDDLTCKICFKVFNCEISMRTHIKRHTQPKNIQCDKCGKAFYYRNLLNKHLIYCNDEKPVECSKCHLKFKTKEALKHHSSVHTDEKPYVCHICGYAGKKLMYLKRHIRSHTGERPYACKVCDMRFSALNGLNRHNKVHTNTKPCVCTFCGKSFTNNWNLKTHERQHTGDTPYKCEQCGMGFKQNVLVKLHMKSHHPYL